MQRVLVVDKNGEPLMPCRPARARQLLKQGRAKVVRHYPFTIQILDREGGVTQPIELKVDPGSRTTGVVLVAYFERGPIVIWAAELQHRGYIIKIRLDKRRAARRSRRNRKCRYRKPRFNNRCGRPKGWLPPSLQSRVDNIETWVRRLVAWVPISFASVETNRFDTQKMENPAISGVEYQQGQLTGYNVREYLLEKWGRKCVYCGVTGVPLQVEHLTPKSRGGSNRAHNLTIACGPCNQRKGSQTAVEFGFPHLAAKAQQRLRDAAIVNATRYATGRVVKEQLPTTFWSGARTKHNRVEQNYPKAHWIDAACVGITGERVYIPVMQPLQIEAVGRGRRQMCLMDRYGFPRTRPKRFKRVKGFQTGDIVCAVVPQGKRKGMHIGRVAIRASGSFRVGKVDGISWRYCQVLHRSDGYECSFLRGGGASSPE